MSAKNPDKSDEVKLFALDGTEFIALSVAPDGRLQVDSDPNSADSGSLNGETLAADDEVTISVTAIGSESLNGQVKSTGQYDAIVRWKDDAGNTIREETVTSNKTGGEWYDIDLNAKSGNAVVAIVDKSSAEQTADGTVNMG